LEGIEGMIPTIFIDMDGVLADLNTGITKLSGNSSITDNRGELFKYWLPKYVQEEGFYTQAPMPNAVYLVDFLTKLHMQGRVNLAILTSHGEFYEPFSEVIRQKKAWLEKNFWKLNKIPFCATSSGADKSILAGPNRLLIDDHSKNIMHFINAGGQGIVYEDHHIEIHYIEILEFLENNYV
jgi:5'(3')-deoxyribonucleotidase